ncbi:zinc finger FYVE domain-containing protein 9 [Nematostella vectensis]|uniref:zinc finger FYVE domain-containing protein 9 n=1 Tax=Nematostella vectensis TaxID=45351 RepID=UPI0020774958|nr:zinc finger FYVE domain-containing protein 9 [Nematostella vectensis]XP_048581612.1 zinc finger FYVE domain-containing protein 9 [Nematostella vectensis]
MSGFVPVDLDQVLNEFEEQEMKNGAGIDTPNNPHPHGNIHNASSMPPSTSSLSSCLHVVGHDSSRTYSFNQPLDSMLECPTTDDAGQGVSLAQEFAELEFRPNNEDDDESIAESDGSSVLAVIAAAEAITEDVPNVEFTNEKTDDLLEYFDNLDVDDRGHDDSHEIESNGTTKCKELEPDKCSDVMSCGISCDKRSVLSSSARKSGASSDLVPDHCNSVQGEISFSNTTHDSDTNSENFNQNEPFKDANISSATGEQERSLQSSCSSDGANNEENHIVSDSKMEISSETGVCSSSLSEDDSNLQTPEEGNENNGVCANNSSLSLEQISNSTYRTEVLEEFPSLQNYIEPQESACQDYNFESSPYNEHAGDSIQTSEEIDVPSDQNDLHEISEGIPDVARDITTDYQQDQSCHVEQEQSDQEVKYFLSNGGESVEDDSQMASGLDSPEFIPHYYYGQPEGNGHSSSPDSLCQSPRVAEQTAVEVQDTPATSHDSVVSPAPSPLPQLEQTPVFISSGDPEMGYVPPIWVPDEVALFCMNCGLKFSLIRRKHHCRACGKVLCSSCCNMKFVLPYLGNKEARVCQVCCDVLLRENRQIPNLQGSNSHQEPSYASTWETTPYMDDGGEPMAPGVTPPSMTPQDVESLADTEVEGAENGAPETSGQPSTSAVEEEGDSFEDPVAQASGMSPPLSPLLLPPSPHPITLEGADSSSSITSPISPAPSDDSDFAFRLDVEQVRAMIPKDPGALPPVLNIRQKVISIQERPDPAELMYRLKGLGESVIFLLNKNLVVKVKIVKLRCCVKKKCWCFVTDGMGAASQEEMVVLLECEKNENTIPKDVLSHFNTAFAYAKQGYVVSDLGFTIFGQPFLGSSNNAGFLYIKPTFQCLENLPLPTVPYVVGVLIQRLEAPWAQLFPLRLMLRLGTEFRYYPCPLWSVRGRPSVYGEIGHTIMNLLTDFKNFQYSIPRVTGLVIHMEETTTTVQLPQDRYDEIVKALNAAEEHMFALGANFSKEADSHLVCIQDGEMYKTQAINIQNKARKVTGASFIVLTGSLKTSTPNTAKVSIVEDGLMVQMVPESILALRKALREMHDFTIKTSPSTSNTVQSVNMVWVLRDVSSESHVSPIDGTVLTEVPSIRVHSSCDFTRREVYRIRWSHVFLKRGIDNPSRGVSSRGLSRLTGDLARACCEALRAHLPGLYEGGRTCLALRVTMDTETAEYAIGAKQEPLPAEIMVDLDNALVPAMNSAALKYGGGPLTLELFFNIIVLF